MPAIGGNLARPRVNYVAVNGGWPRKCIEQIRLEALHKVGRQKRKPYANEIDAQKRLYGAQQLTLPLARAQRAETLRVPRESPRRQVKTKAAAVQSFAFIAGTIMRGGGYGLIGVGPRRPGRLATTLWFTQSLRRPEPSRTQNR